MSTPSPAERPAWDQVWLHVAEAVSARSLCTRSKVGAVIVTPAHRVVAVGYNNPPAGFSHRDEPCTAWCPRANPPVSWRTTDRTVNHVLVTDTSGTYLELDTPFEGVQRSYLETDQDWLTFGYERVEELDPGYADCPSLHAEANALSVCDRVQREGGTIYVTSHVCHACAKLIANSGLSRVVVSTSAAETAAHRDPERSYGLLRDCSLTVDVELW